MWNISDECFVATTSLLKKTLYTSTRLCLIHAVHFMQRTLLILTYTFFWSYWTVSAYIDTKKLHKYCFVGDKK